MPVTPDGQLKFTVHDFENARVFDFGTTDDGRPFPCEEAFALRLPFVRGRLRGGLLACSLPTMVVR